MITPDPSQRDEASHEDDMVSQGMNGEEEEEDQLVEENPWPPQDRVAYVQFSTHFTAFAFNNMPTGNTSIETTRKALRLIRNKLSYLKLRELKQAILGNISNPTSPNPGQSR
ncbi:hypothetical protein FRC03_009211 [Tulasnella sp. 419]|nr:hypothetical protein FRC03_009211 [Tulasnella sp. 419]